MRLRLLLLLSGLAGMGCLSTAPRVPDPPKEIRPLSTPAPVKVSAQGIDEHNARRIARDLHDELDREALKKPN